MKKMLIFSLTFVFSLLMSVSYAEAKQISSIENERIAKKQEKLIERMEKEIEKSGLNINDLDNVGDYYFLDDELVLQVKKSSKKYEKLIQKYNELSIKMKKDVSAQIHVQTVNYSYNELLDKRTTFKGTAKELGIELYSISIDQEKNNLKLMLSEAANEETKLKLNKIYGDMLYIDVNPELEKEHAFEFEKARKDNYNSLGGGIAIHQGAGACTMAGIAKKGKEFFIMTAGHCVDKTPATIYQYNKVLGLPHLDSRSSDYDFGLVKIVNSPLVRYATNGLYIENADSSGYDSSFSGSLALKKGLKVCKSGITTGQTCGEYQHTEQAGLLGNGLVKAIIYGPDGETLSDKGDSGSPWYTQSLPRRLVAIHWGGNPNNGDVSYATPWTEVADKYGLSLYESSTPTLIN